MCKVKLSIIIPVYNVEKYIEKCLVSCLKQNVSYDTYEIIVINDGTPDDSMKIVNDYQNKYPQCIKVFSQQNAGLSAARNKGMELAGGEYLWFIDSDDYIEENCLERIISCLKNNLDILQLQYRLVYEDNRMPKDVSFCLIDETKTGKQVTEQGGLPAPAQFSIFRSRFLSENKLKFVHGIYHEDAEFKPRAIYLASKVVSDNNVSYNYLQRKMGSITSSFKLKNGLDLLYVMNSLIRFADENNMSYKYRKCLYDKIGTNMNSLLNGYNRLCNREKQILYSELINNKSLFGYMMRATKLKYRIEGFVCKFNVKLGLSLYRILK